MSARRSGAKTTRTPRLAEMTLEECQALLKRHNVGRMAYCTRDRVDIAPIHYVYSDGWLFARTSQGQKMDALAHAPWPAFEVDEIDGVFDWRSVVVHGTLHTMDPDGSPDEVERWTHGVELLRQIVPETLTEDDPVPFRELVFGIYAHTVTGRASTTRSD